MRGFAPFGFAALALGFVEMAAAEESFTLVPQDCPFEISGPNRSHTASCYRFSRPGERSGRIAFDVAVMTPASQSPSGHVIYIPGGPGDAPVSADGPPAALQSLFPTHVIAAFNPRGVKSSSPRLHCDFGNVVWEEDFSGAVASTAVEDCRNKVEPVLAQADFDAPAIADDVSMVVRRLGFDEAGVFSVSYGTETALHLLADPPDWLSFAILDSVSLPGIGGLEDEMVLRERFLDALQARCFDADACGDVLRADYDGLLDWAAQFDEAPLTFLLGPDDAEWRFDGAEMLDYLYELSAFPTGIEVAAELVAQLETNRLQALAWIRNDLTATIEYARESLALSMEAFSDSGAFDSLDALEMKPRYPTDLAAWRDLGKLYRLWNRANRREAPYVGLEGHAQAPVPVLVLSGGLDAVTPDLWATRLARRLSGLEHYVFPNLGHAVSFGNPADTADPEIAEQLRCVARVLRGFRATPRAEPPPCPNYRRDSQ